MAVKITDIRETIGINDEPISVCAMQTIHIEELNKKGIDAGTAKVRNAKSTDLEQGMVIPVYTGKNPNKQQDVEMDK